MLEVLLYLSCLCSCLVLSVEYCLNSFPEGELETRWHDRTKERVIWELCIVAVDMSGAEHRSQTLTQNKEAQLSRGQLDGNQPREHRRKKNRFERPRLHVEQTTPASTELAPRVWDTPAPLSTDIPTSAGASLRSHEGGTIIIESEQLCSLYRLGKSSHWMVSVSAGQSTERMSGKCMHTSVRPRFSLGTPALHQKQRIESAPLNGLTLPPSRRRYRDGR